MKKKQTTAELTEKAVKLYDSVFVFAFSRLKDREAACDIAQTVMEKAIKQMETLRNTDALKSWIMQITNNEINSYYRRLQKEQSYDVPDLEDLHEVIDIEADILNQLLKKEEKGNAIKALLSLDKKYQEILRLHIIYEWSHKAIAEELGINYGTVKTRYVRGVKLLKKAFDEYEEGGHADE